jgi:hypothetical protein
MIIEMFYALFFEVLDKAMAEKIVDACDTVFEP